MTFEDKMVNTKYSRVLGISKIDFTPAETTAIGVLPSSVRSDDISSAEKGKEKKKKMKLRSERDDLLDLKSLR